VVQEAADDDDDSGHDTEGDVEQKDEFDEVQLNDKPQHVVTQEDEAFLEVHYS
jgi:hypothetical protein